jgi:hypothetical protein
VSYGPNDNSPGARLARQYTGTGASGVERHDRQDFAKRAMAGARTLEDQRSAHVPSHVSPEQLDRQSRHAYAVDALLAAQEEESRQQMLAQQELYEQALQQEAAQEADLQDAIEAQYEDDDEDEYDDLDDDERALAEGRDLWLTFGLENGFVDPSGVISEHADPNWLADGQEFGWVQSGQGADEGQEYGGRGFDGGDFGDGFDYGGEGGYDGGE